MMKYKWKNKLKWNGIEWTGNANGMHLNMQMIWNLNEWKRNFNMILQRRLIDDMIWNSEDENEMIIIEYDYVLEAIEWTRSEERPFYCSLQQ